jgi:hypothetical protein
MNRKEFEIILYNSRLVGIAKCRYHNMECGVEIENKRGGIVLTYFVEQHHFRDKLASGECIKCPYFVIEVQLDGGCKIEVLYRYGSEDTLRLTPSCEDYKGMINYFKPIEVKVKSIKFK